MIAVFQHWADRAGEEGCSDHRGRRCPGAGRTSKSARLPPPEPRSVTAARRWLGRQRRPSRSKLAPRRSTRRHRRCHTVKALVLVPVLGMTSCCFNDERSNSGGSSGKTLSFGEVGYPHLGFLTGSYVAPSVYHEPTWPRPRSDSITTA